MLTECVQGYSERTLRRRRRDIAQRLKKTRARAEAHLLNVQRQQQEPRARELPQLRDWLRGWEEALLRLLRALVKIDAARQAAIELWNDAYPAPSSMSTLNGPSWAVESLALRVELLDPDIFQLPFPGSHLPSSIHAAARETWRRTKDPDTVMSRTIAPWLLRKERLASIVTTARTLSPVIDTSRPAVLAELGALVRARRWHAATLVAVTQVEGIVWDYALYLSRKGIRIVGEIRRKRPKRYGYYRWDLDKKDYKDKDSPRKPRLHENKNGDPIQLRSANTIVRDTAFGLVLPYSLWLPLIERFFSDRNAIAHGRYVADRNDACSAILTLRELLESITRFETRRSSGTWRDRESLA